MSEAEATETPTSTPPAKPAKAGRRGPKVMGHTYDGIQEYDNPLPGWWSLLFFLTFVHSVGYVIYYHYGPGASDSEAYVAEFKEYEQKRAAREAKEANLGSEAMMKTAMDDSATLDRGKAVFATRCVGCHGPGGEGLIGPNLTDGHQLHGSARLDIFKTVRGGVPGTTMVSWSGLLSADELRAVAAYAASLRGQNKPGKPSEGEPVGPFED